MARCPFCGEDKLSLMPDPLSENGRWMHCQCGFQGDSLDLLSRVQKIPDVRETIRRGIATGLCSNAEEITSNLINSYLRFYYEFRRETVRQWDALRWKVSNKPNTEMINRLQNAGLWPGFGGAEHEGLSKFLGAAAAADVKNIFHEEILPKCEGTAIVLNYQDVPGRTCAFQFIGTRNSFLHFCRQDSSVGSDEGGLAMFETLDVFEDTVFALGDPIIALNLQRKNFSDSPVPLKMVVYNESTNRALNVLDARKVIFWAPELDWQVFAKARQAKNSCIALQPHIKACGGAGGIEDHLSSYAVDYTLQLMRNSAKPWMKVLVEWIVDDKQPETMVQEGLRSLNLTSPEKEQLLAQCEPPQRVRLEHALAGGHLTRSTISDGASIVAEPDCMMRLYPSQGRKDLICGANVNIYEEAVDPETSRTSWIGDVVCQGRRITFNSEVNRISKMGADEWLAKLLGSHGIPRPVMHPNWVGRFMFLWRMLNTPRATIAAKRLGVLRDGQILFPRFKMVDGVIKNEGTSILTDNAPGKNVCPPVARQPGRFDAPFDARSVWVLAGCAVIANWLIYLRELPSMPIALVGTRGSAAQAGIKALATGMDMNKLTLEYHPKKDARVWQQVGEFNYPAWIEPLSSGALQHLPELSSSIAAVCANQAEAAALATNGRWIRIFAPQLHLDQYPLPPFDDFLFYLLQLQKDKFSLPESPSTVEAVLASFCKWYGVYLKLDQAETYKQALKMLVPPTNPGDALLDLYFTLAHAGRLAVLHGKAATHESTRRVGVELYDNEAFLRAHPLRLICDTDCLPTIDGAAATRDFASRGLSVGTQLEHDGWKISREYWEQQATAWKARFLPS